MKNSRNVINQYLNDLIKFFVDLFVNYFFIALSMLLLSSFSFKV